MRLINHTPLTAGFTLGMSPDGGESLVIVIKGSFTIPHVPGETPTLLARQLPLCEADTFSGDPGHSSPLHESDHALIKHRCDVSLIGSAYAPQAKPVERVQTTLQVGSISKQVDVLGDRRWIADSSGVWAGPVTPFLVRPITYDIAFGGADRSHNDPRYHDSYRTNPIGIGYHKSIDPHLIDGSPAPSTEAPGIPVDHPQGSFRPMSYGPLGRSWYPRISYAGTYEDHWLDEQFPFLPDDFDPRYYQCAPEDQQCQYLQGGEKVSLSNLTPEGRCQFMIPRLEMPVCFFKTTARRVETKAVIDTLVIEPDEQRFSLTWRAQLRLHRSIFDIPEVLVGTANRLWWRSRDTGKHYYPSLARLARHDGFGGQSE